MGKNNILVTTFSHVIYIGSFIGLNDIKLWTFNYKIAVTKVQYKRSMYRNYHFKTTLNHQRKKNHFLFFIKNKRNFELTTVGHFLLLRFVFFYAWTPCTISTLPFDLPSVQTFVPFPTRKLFSLILKKNMVKHKFIHNLYVPMCSELQKFEFRCLWWLVQRCFKMLISAYWKLISQICSRNFAKKGPNFHIFITFYIFRFQDWTQ